MTENSPENLRKFLESDDSAMVQMGIYLAKGTGIDITVNDLEHFLWSDDIETIKTGVILADEAEIIEEYFNIVSNRLSNKNENVKLGAAKVVGVVFDRYDGQVDYWDEIAFTNSVSTLHKANKENLEFEDFTDEKLLIRTLKAFQGLFYSFIPRNKNQKRLWNIIFNNDINNIKENLPNILSHSDWTVRALVAQILRCLGWAPETDRQRTAYLIASNDWDFFVETQKGLLEHCKLLLSDEKILNLRQDEFVNIIEHRKISLETMKRGCTAKELIKLTASASPTSLWLIACAVIELSRIPKADINKLFWLSEHTPGFFWSEISFPEHVLTKKDRDEIVKTLKIIPDVIAVNIGKKLYNYVIKAWRNQKSSSGSSLSSAQQKTYKMYTTIFEDPTLAKRILGRMQ